MLLYHYRSRLYLMVHPAILSNHCYLEKMMFTKIVHLALLKYDFMNKLCLWSILLGQNVYPHTKFSICPIVLSRNSVKHLLLVLHFFCHIYYFHLKITAKFCEAFFLYLFINGTIIFYSLFSYIRVICLQIY